MSSFLEKLKKGLEKEAEEPVQEEQKKRKSSIPEGPEDVGEVEEIPEEEKPLKKEKRGRKPRIKKSAPARQEDESIPVNAQVKEEKIRDEAIEEIREEIKKELAEEQPEGNQKKQVEVEEKPVYKKIEPAKEETPKEKAEAPKITVNKKNWFEAEGQLVVDVYQTDNEVVIQSAIAGVKPEDLDISIENDVVSIKGSRPKQDESEERKYFYQECYWGRFSREIILPVEVNETKVEAAMKDGILTIKIPRAGKDNKRKIVVK